MRCNHAHVRVPVCSRWSQSGLRRLLSFNAALMLAVDCLSRGGVPSARRTLDCAGASPCST